MIESSADWILPLLSIILLLLALMGSIIIITPQLTPESTRRSCPRGYCSNNIYDGIKTCPPTNEGFVQYEPGIEVCNPPNACNPRSQTPCTYTNSEAGSLCPGDREYTGICPEGSPDCRCLNRIYCPNFATVYFDSLIIPNSGIDPTNTTAFRTFVQNTTWKSNSNTPRNDLPLSIGNFGQTGEKSCGLSRGNLPLAWPPGECLRGQFGYNIDDDLWYCMDLPIICGKGTYPNRYVDGRAICVAYKPDPFD